jgi:hypothetical protein
MAQGQDLQNLCLLGRLGGCGRLSFLRLLFTAAGCQTAKAQQHSQSQCKNSFQHGKSLLMFDRLILADISEIARNKSRIIFP